MQVQVFVARIAGFWTDGHYELLCFAFEDGTALAWFLGLFVAVAAVTAAAFAVLVALFAAAVSARLAATAVLLAPAGVLFRRLLLVLLIGLVEHVKQQWQTLFQKWQRLFEQRKTLLQFRQVDAAVLEQWQRFFEER